MANIIKMRVSTHPYPGQRIEMVCDFERKSYSYKNEKKQEERIVKMTDQQFEVFMRVLSQVTNLEPSDYLGPITNNGMYWEFDLVNDRNKMVEIEGINVIDEKVLNILLELEDTINKPLGVNEFRLSVSNDS